MDYVLATISNEGNRERAHSGFRRKIQEACLTGLKLKPIPNDRRLIVLPGSLAEKAGLKDGDEAISVAGREVLSAAEFVKLIEAAPAGARVLIKRDGEKRGSRVTELLKWAASSICVGPIAIAFSGCETPLPGPVLVQVRLPDSVKLDDRLWWEKREEKWPTQNPFRDLVESLGRSLAGFYFENGYDPRRVEVQVFNALQPPLAKSVEEALARPQAGQMEASFVTS